MKINGFDARFDKEGLNTDADNFQKPEKCKTALLTNPSDTYSL